MSQVLPNGEEMQQMNELERSDELQRLSMVLQQVEKQLHTATVMCAESQKELRDTLGDYWDNTGRNSADTAQYIEVIDRQRTLSAITENKRRQLVRMADSPYFGRLDFAEENTEPEMFYIGIASLSAESSSQHLVYDWRTPVAGMFYDFERGSAWYQCPAGVIEGTITRKRQYKIVKGNMVYLFDSDIKIDDEMLQELLTKSVDEQMHTIVTSIQREQNQIIRNEGHRVVFVRGPAGSGKTSIALHRIAFLLYRDRDTLTSQNVLILSPNHIFSEYISNVLPEIGEENVLRMTFHDCVSNSARSFPVGLETRSNHLESLLASQDPVKLHIRAASIGYKSSAAFEELISRYTAYIDRDLLSEHPAIQFAGRTLFSRKDWQNCYLDTFSFLPPARRIAKIQEVIQRRIRPLVHELRRQKATEITATGEEVNEKTILALARLAAKKLLTPLYQEIERLTSFDLVAAYTRIFEDESMFRRLNGNLPIPPEWPAIKQQTLSSLQNGQVPYEDCFPFLFLQGKLEGFAARPEIKHLVIDEAQDYTSLQYRIMAYLFPNSSWTVLGDPAQTIHPYLQTADFETAASLIGKPDPIFFLLNRSYRSTRQIQAFCQSLLPPAARTESVHRDGSLPQVCRVEPGSVAWFLHQTIQELRQEGRQSIAIICKTVSACLAVTRVLDGLVKFSLITNEEDNFQRGTVVIPAYLVKGLEFDAVVVMDADTTAYGREADRHLLYTICTRALHRLILHYSGHPSPLLGSIDPQLYRGLHHSKGAKLTIKKRTGQHGCN